MTTSDEDEAVEGLAARHEDEALVVALRAPSFQQDSAWHHDKAVYATKPKDLLTHAAAALRVQAEEIENWKSRAAERDAECERRFRAQHDTEAALAKIRDERDAQAEEIERLNDRNVEASMLAHKWMVAHDMLQAGKPVEYPEPADVPNAIARAERAEAALAKVQAENAEVVGALLPFVEAALCLDNPQPDHMEIWEHPAAMCITAGDLRRARALHAKLRASTDPSDNTVTHD